MLEQEIWAYQNHPVMDPWGKNLPSLTVVVHSSLHTLCSGEKQHLTVNIADLSVLECPPLSLATLHLLGSCMQTSPSFDSPLPYPSQQPLLYPTLTSQSLNHSSISLAPDGPSNVQCPARSSFHPGSCSLNPHSPIRSGCFSSLLLSARPTKSAQHSTSDPCRKLLKEFHIGKHSDKQKKG